MHLRPRTPWCHGAIATNLCVSSSTQHSLTDSADGGLCTWRCLRLNRPNTPSDWPRHRLTCDTPLGFMIISVDPISPRAFVKEEAQVCFCRTLYQTREPSIQCTSFASFPFSLFLLVETLSTVVCLLGLFLSPCPRPWFCPSCLASSGFLSLALVPVLALAQLSFTLAVSLLFRGFFFFIPFPFVLCPLAPARGLPVSPYCICDCLRYFSPSTSSDSSCVSVTRPKSVNAFVTDVWTRFCCRSPGR